MLDIDLTIVWHYDVGSGGITADFQKSDFYYTFNFLKSKQFFEILCQSEVIADGCREKF